jgi:hypothetical protein
VFFTLYDLGLLFFLPSAVLSIYYDFRYRGVPFKAYIPAGVGMVTCVYYVLSKLPQLWEYLTLQIIAISTIAIVMHMMTLAGNDDMIFMITLSGIFLGVGFIVVGSAIILLLHLIYRRLKRLTDNPYSDKYSYYPYPACGFMGIMLIIFVIITFVFFVYGVPICGNLCGPQWF